VIAGFAVGGILYTFALGALLDLFGQRRLMLAGGMIAAGALVIIGLGGWWPFQLAAFVALGLGFYLLHGPIQIFVTELAPQARGAATALHSTFFFAGHGVGPVYYGLAFAALGTGASLVMGAAAILAVAVACVRLLHDRPPDEKTGLVQRS
jgi:predicted MFS family arabinose efflux permease